MYDHLTDKELISYEEDTAFRILYDRYWKALYRKALSRLGSDADAQDVVQEVFISCWRNRHTIEVEDTLAPYLFTALKFSIIRRVTRAAQKGRTLPLTTGEQDPLQPGPEDRIRYKELEALISEEVSVMPGRMQQVYLMSRVEHRNTAQIASELHLSEQTIKNTLTAALKRLRKRLSQYSCWLFSFL